MQDQAAAMSQQITAVTLDVVNSMRRRSMTLVPNLQQDPSPSHAADEQRRLAQAQNLESVRARLAAWERMRARLASLSARCDRLIQDHSASEMR